MNEIKEVIKSITPGVVGAASGVVYTRVHWLKRIANIFVSSATIYNDDGEQIGTEPAPQSLTHNWAGWPQIITE